MKMFIIVPVFNKAKRTELFLRSIEAQYSQNIRVIVVNDGSTDETSAVLKQFENRLELTVLETENLWWGGSINFGLRWLWSNCSPSDNDLIVLANNDVELSENFIAKIVDRIESLGSCLCHPRVIDGENVVVSSGSRILSWVPFVTIHPKNNAASPGDLIEVDFLTARFLIGKTKIFKDIGYIPERLPHYQGDYYLSYRAKRQGYKNYILPDLQVSLDDSETGLKTNNIVSWSELLRSLKSIRSANNLHHRYIFVRSFHSTPLSVLIWSSMVCNIFGRYFLKRLRYKFAGLPDSQA